MFAPLLSRPIRRPRASALALAAVIGLTSACASGPKVTAADAPAGSLTTTSAVSTSSTEPNQPSSSTSSTAKRTTTPSSRVSSNATSTTASIDPDAGDRVCVASTATTTDGKPAVDVPLGPPPTVLTITDLKVGTGEEVTDGSSVTVHYVGVACSTGEQFDASWDNGNTFTFSLDQVIPGWTEGIPGMKVGGRRLLVIPPDMAYGNRPPPGSNIAKGETLIFVVDLVAVS